MSSRLVLVIAVSVLLGIYLAGYGAYGYVRGKTHVIDRNVGGSGMRKVVGPEARRASLIYVAIGIAWSILSFAGSWLLVGSM